MARAEVLVVTENQMVAARVIEALASAGHQLIDCVEPSGAVSRLASDDTPHLVLIDCVDAERAAPVLHALQQLRTGNRVFALTDDPTVRPGATVTLRRDRFTAAELFAAARS